MPLSPWATSGKMPNLDYTLTVPRSLVLSRPSQAAGFGEYEQFSEQDFKGQQTTQKTHALIGAILSGVGGTAVIAAMIFLSVPVIPACFALAGLAAAGVYSYVKFHAIQNQFPPSLTEGLSPKDFNCKAVGETIQERGHAVVLPDSIASKKCKLDLIRHAQSSIFLSCYMGEEAFDEALDLIKERMDQNRELKVFIFGSDFFLTSENKKRLQTIQSAHPNRFFTVLNPEIYLSQHPKSGHLALSTNHIKLMTIDEGIYSVVGGTALRPFWTDVAGTEHLAKGRAGFDLLRNPLDAKGFRDMDFAFKSASRGAGTTAFLEGAKLMLRYAYMQAPELAARLKTEFQALMRRAPATTIVPSLDARVDRAHNARVKWYSSGPDHTQNSYLNALIDLVNSATRKIRIAHMYFHPPQSFIDALSNAAKRGVKIEIITNSKSKETPGSHRFFVDLTQNKYRQLFEREGHQNVKVHEFYRANTTYHKKVIVVDDRFTAFGSSNLGKKSLGEHADDYEFNGIVDSGELARATNEVLQKDIELSDEVSPENAKNLSWGTRLLAYIQELIMAHIL
jgi:phosphatidylserine/phosphatidylglycerophosphate/cardiolipin synthase-like enzyme